MVAASASMEHSLAGGKQKSFLGAKRRGAIRSNAPANDLKLTDQQQQSTGVIAKAAAKGLAAGQSEFTDRTTHSDASKRGLDSATGAHISSIADKAQHENPNRWGQALATINKGVSATLEPQSSASVASMPAPRQQQTGKQKPSSETSKPDQAQNAGRGQQQISRTGSQENDKAFSSAPVAASNGSSAPAAAGRKQRGGASPRNNSSTPAAASGSAAASTQQQENDSSPAAPPRMSYSAIISQQSRGMSKLGAPRPTPAAPAKPAAAQEPFPPLTGDAAPSKGASSSAGIATAAASPAAQPAAKAATAETASKGAVEKASATTQAKPFSKPAPATSSTSSGNSGNMAAGLAPAVGAADKPVSPRSRQDKGRHDPATRWVPKPSSDAGSRGDSPSSRPRRGSGNSSGGAGKLAAAPSSLKPVDSHSTAAAGSSGVPAAVVPSSLPPNPSIALAAKAATASAGHQQQHVGVQLPSSQAVNMAAVSSHNRSRIASSGFGTSVPTANSGFNSSSAYTFDGFGASFDAEDSFGSAFTPVYEPEQSSQVAAGTAKLAPASAHAAAPAPAHMPAAASQPAAPQAAVPGAAPAAAAAAPAASPAASQPAAPAAHNSSTPSGSGPAPSHPCIGQVQQQVEEARPAVQVQDVPAAAAPSGNKSTSSARHSSSGGGLSVNAPPFNPQLVPFQAGSYVTSSGAASNSSSRSGSIYSNQLEQQMFAGAVGSSAAAAVAATATLSSTGGSKTAASIGPCNSSTGVSSSVQWASQPWSSWFSEMSQAMHAHEQAVKQQQEQKDSKIREQQQQVEKERSSRIAAEDKLASMIRELDSEKHRNKDLEDTLAAATNKAGKLEASLADLSAEYDRVLNDAQVAGQESAYLHDQLAIHMQEKAGLEAQLAEWKDSYNRTEQENKMMRDMLGPRAPAPHSLTAEAAGLRAPAAAPAAAGSTKQPPPGFGPMPAAQQRQALAPAAAAAATAAAAAAAAPPSQPQTPTYNAEQHKKNEHELVRILLSFLSEDPARALVWGEGENAAVDAELLPLSWQLHYLPMFGDLLTFMRQRPAVFGEVTGAPYPMFFKQRGAEQKVNEAEEAERAAAAPAPWHMQGQQQQQQSGFGDASGLMPEQQGLVGPTAAAAAGTDQQGGWGGHGIHASLPTMPPAAFPGLSMPFMAPPQGLMGHGMVPPMSMPMASPSMPAVGQGLHHHQGMHPHHGW